MNDPNWGRRFKFALHCSDYSVRVLASELGVAFSTVQKWTKGAVPVAGTDLLPLLANLLDCPLRSLLYNEPAETRAPRQEEPEAGGQGRETRQDRPRAAEAAMRGGAKRTREGSASAGRRQLRHRP